MALSDKDKAVVDKAIKSVPKGMSKEDKQTLKDIKEGKDSKGSKSSKK